ncbi:Ubiquitin carboxyl-terminal hydrolase Usp2 [Taenia solium]|eukprot:TsM_000678900 transcript=TsM_000678900 gene=TsM_000678900
MVPKSEKIDRAGENGPEKSRKSASGSKSKELAEISSREKSVQLDSSPKLRTPSGLENLGNTCYLNAILQCLRSTELVRDYCYSFDDVSTKQLRSNGDLFRTFASLIRRMELVNNGSIGSGTILKFKNSFTRFVPCYGGNLQQDASEFFTYLLDGLHEEIKERPQTPVLEEPTLLRTVSTVASPPPSIVPTKFRRRYKRRIGGLKHSESSKKFTAASGKDVEAWPDSGGSCHPKSLIRKRSKGRQPKVRTVSISRVDSLQFDDVCQPALGSAETTATEKSFLKDTFVGHLQTQVRCLQCNNVSTRDELFWNLALCVPEIPSDKESKDKAQRRTASSSTPVDTSVSLDDCLRAFTKAEVLDDLDRILCTKCKTLTKVQLQVMISRLPKILVLQFQRFESTCCKNKKRHLIKFDFEQNMAPYYVNGSTEKQVATVPEKTSTPPQCTDSSTSLQLVDPATATVDVAASTSKADNTAASDSTNYRLYAVVYHQGGTQHGHYTARCRLPSPGSSTEPYTWFLFDDENVSRVLDPKKDVIQPTAYILFYERIDGKDDSTAPSKTMQDAVSPVSETAPVKVTADSEDAS